MCVLWGGVGGMEHLWKTWGGGGGGISTSVMRVRWSTI